MKEDSVRKESSEFSSSQRCSVWRCVEAKAGGVVAIRYYYVKDVMSLGSQLLVLGSLLDNIVG